MSSVGQTFEQEDVAPMGRPGPDAATYTHAAIVLIGVHVAAALKHALIDRHRVLQRMWPPRRAVGR